MTKTLTFALLFGFNTVNVFAGGVTDNNNGSAGDLLIHSGTNNGANSIGTWVDSSKFKGEKGDKGNRGPRGFRGQAGRAGRDVDPEALRKFEEEVKEWKRTKYYFVPQIRIYDNKGFEVKPYAKFDTTNNFDFREAGLKLTVKFGKSYEERLIEKQSEQIQRLSDALGVPYEPVK